MLLLSLHSQNAAQKYNKYIYETTKIRGIIDNG
jgi:hypothetical protein